MFKIISKSILAFIFSTLFIFGCISLVRHLSGVNDDISFSDTISFFDDTLNGDNFTSNLWYNVNREIKLLIAYIENNYFNELDKEDSFLAAITGIPLISKLFNLSSNQFLSSSINYVFGLLPFLLRLLYIPIIFSIFAVSFVYRFISFFMLGIPF